MPLTSNAAPDELDSPFYIENEKLCNAWNDYITEKNGQLNGIYNAWSFDIKSKVTTNRSWLINVKKSTYSSGNLLLSSKYQNLQESLMFRANDFNTN